MPQGVRITVEIAGALVGLVALLVAWGVYWRHRLRTDHPFDRVVDLPTGDGASVVVARVRAAREPLPLAPVVLVHGLAMNRRAMAFDMETSLAGALARAARDVWCVELRGARRGAFARRHARSDFDTYLEHDVPVALDHVLAGVVDTDCPTQKAYEIGCCLPDNACGVMGAMGCEGNVVPDAGCSYPGGADAGTDAPPDAAAAAAPPDRVRQPIAATSPENAVSASRPSGSSS